MSDLSSSQGSNFSHLTRTSAIQKMAESKVDLLVIGGGITGAAVARDAVSRGLKVALVEREDFSFGTSSRSSKLIHGGLRYLENLELGLVFESLAERALLMRTAPHMVRPLPFYLPAYTGSKIGKNTYDLGLWLYDLLALFRTPGFHKRLSRSKMKREIPALRSEGLEGGFRYYDASMWDDVLAIEVLRSAVDQGAWVASYTAAEEPLWEGDRLVGFRMLDRLSASKSRFEVRAQKVIFCTGPWADEIGAKVDPNWKHWLKPSKGVHLIFDAKRVPLPGTLIMSHPLDGRISFAIPRPDYGPGVVIVGTTDGPTSSDPTKARVDAEDLKYLLELLNRYLPDLKLTQEDVISAYVGVRPLVDPHFGMATGESGAESSATLQKVSREHRIDHGPGKSVMVAGGKYTTHRTMGEEIVDFALRSWGADAKAGTADSLPEGLIPPCTWTPVNPRATLEGRKEALKWAEQKGCVLPPELLDRYGDEARDIFMIDEALRTQRQEGSQPDPEGFPMLEAQFVYAIRTGGVMKLQDFFLRRVPLYYCRPDHGRPWAESLARLWVRECGGEPESSEGKLEAQAQVEDLDRVLRELNAWRSDIGAVKGVHS